MNIFVLHTDPIVAARSLCDKHVPKMVLESAQLLCTTVHVLSSGAVQVPYRPTHRSHPCSTWTRESYDNFLWLASHALALADEYKLRFGKWHASLSAIERARTASIDARVAFPIESGMTPFVQAMPRSYRRDDAVEAYRAYYFGEKRRVAEWCKGRDAPRWFVRMAATIS